MNGISVEIDRRPGDEQGDGLNHEVEAGVSEAQIDHYKLNYCKPGNYYLTVLMIKLMPGRTSHCQDSAG